MRFGRLRVLTTVGPVSFVLVLGVLAVFVLRPTFGSESVLPMVIVFAVLSLAVVPFSFWVFAIVESQQHVLAARYEELEVAHQRAAQHNRQLGAVNQAIRSISSELGLEHVLQNITDAARTLLGCRYAALGVADVEGRILRFITSGMSTEQRAKIGPLPVGRGLLGLLIKQGEPIRVPEIAAHPRSSGFPPTHPAMHSLLGVPIVFKERVMGDLYLTDKLDAPEFSQGDEEMLLLLAKHAAVALENARLYEEARSSRDRLQLWNGQLEAIVGERTREIQHYRREFTTRVLDAQEDERKRIARELHDDTAQSLSSILITLDLLEPHIPAGNTALDTGFGRVRALSKRTLDEVRALSHALRPTMLDDFGLVPALRWFADEFALTYGYRIEVNIEPIPDRRLPPEVELALFRIAQEALTNTGKYSHATHTRVTMSFPDGEAQLVIEDNGQGFVLDEIAAPTRHGGLGLLGMRERAELLGGHITIESSPGCGTRTLVAVPLPAIDDDPEIVGTAVVRPSRVGEMS